MSGLDYSQIIDVLSCGIVVLDRELRVVSWNRWMEDHSRLNREAVQGRILTELFPEIEAKGFRWKAESVFTLGNFAFYSQRLHRYLFPFGHDAYLNAGFEQMQQNVILAPIRDSQGIVNYVCVSVMDNTDAVVARERLEYLTRQLEEASQTDHLTQLPNRRHLMGYLEKEISRHRREGTQFTCAILDIDHFKMVNDTLGHQCGDLVLAEVAGLFKLRLRNYDFVGRYGGEEFCVVLPGTPIATAHTVLERLRIAVAGHRFTYETKDYSVTVSIGASSLERMHSPDLNLVLKQADEALYRAKANGRNQTVLY